MMFQRMNLVVMAALVAVGCSGDESASASPALLGQEVSAERASSAADGGAAAAATTAVSGTSKAAGCYSYTKAEPDSGTCNGYYCGATEAQIAQSLPENPVCALEAADICQGTLTDAVATCTRSVIIAHLGDPIEPLRPLIQDCVFQNETIKAKVSGGCIGCFLNVAICAASNCLIECLADSPSCDACRQKANCEEPVFACGGLPNPL